jgi:8-oxo-dGTP diphosphatase
MSSDQSPSVSRSRRPGTTKVAAHVLLWRGDAVLLARRFHTGFEDGNYAAVSGHNEVNEPVTATAVREAREEIGVSIDPSDLHFVCVLHRRSTEERVDFFFSVSKWEGSVANLEPQKCDDLRWFPASDLPVNTVSYVRRVLDNIARGITFDEFWPAS